MIFIEDKMRISVVRLGERIYFGSKRMKNHKRIMIKVNCSGWPTESIDFRLT